VTDAKSPLESTHPATELIAEPCQRLVSDRARLLAAIRARKHRPVTETTLDGGDESTVATPFIVSRSE
jgi:hypothetical protein